MNKKRRSLNILNFLPVVLLTLMVVFMTAARFPKEIETIAEDELYQQAGAIPHNIKIIAIDETTLDKLGPYSDWDRSYFAKLIERLDSVPDAKPLVIGMDVIFSGTNNSESDRKLSDAAEKAGNVILASKLETDSRVARSESRESYTFQSFVRDEITAYDELSSVCESGFTNIILDDDGFVRRAYSCVDYEGKTYKSFAYLIAEKAGGSDRLSDLPEVAEIRYTGNPGEFETIPMSKVLDGEIPADYFKDCIVLVGAHEEGMLDSYKTPIDRSSEMYGVECHANAIYSFLEQRLIKTAPLWTELLIAAVFAAMFALIMRKCRLLTGILAMTIIAVGYPFAARVVFALTSVRLSVLYIPLGVIIELLVYLLLRYVELQKKRVDEMQNMLFSMADSMAEAIEGRTPYNANHTKNVAKRCIEMLDHINRLYREKKTDLHFSEKDKNQLYLAAMLHDIGKMDVPLEVMDKPTKLGHHEAPLRSRLEIIKLHITNDALTGVVPKDEADAQIKQIQAFLDKLGLYNCGRRLEDEDLAAIDKMCACVYRSEKGSVLHIGSENSGEVAPPVDELSEMDFMISRYFQNVPDYVTAEAAKLEFYYCSDFSQPAAVANLAAPSNETSQLLGSLRDINEQYIDTVIDKISEETNAQISKEYLNMASQGRIHPTDITAWYDNFPSHSVTITDNGISTAMDFSTVTLDWIYADMTEEYARENYSYLPMSDVNDEGRVYVVVGINICFYASDRNISEQQLTLPEPTASEDSSSVY